MNAASRWRVALLLFGGVCALYANTLSHGFHYDDFHSLVHNPHLRSLANLPAFFTDPTVFSVNPESAMYRPVLLASYAVNYALGEGDPTGYHLGNVALHAVNAVLVYWLLLVLVRDPRWAALSAALFAINPLNAEAVNYVSSRSEVLMATFFLAACLSYLHSSRAGYLAAVLAGGLALATKSVAIVLPGILGVCDWVAGKGRRWPRYLPFVLLAGGYIAFTRRLIDKALLDPVRPLDIQLWTQLKAAVYYLMLSVMPAHLSVEHQFFLAQRWWEGPVLAAGSLLLSLVVVSWRWKWGKWAGLWWVFLLLPAGVVPLIALVNEHRLYLAGIGLSLVVAGCLARLGRHGQTVAYSAIAVYTILLSLHTYQRSQVWADELSLWRDAAAHGPLMLKPHLRLGDALVQAGELEAAEVSYRRAVALRPQHPAAHNNLGVLYMRLGRLREAEAEFRAVLAASPDQVQARLNLGKALLGLGQWQEAESEYQRSIDFGEATGEAHQELGFIALNFRQAPEQALARYDEALARAGERAGLWVGKGAALRQMQRYQEAEAAYRRAIQLDTAQVEAWFNLGNLYLEQQRLSEAAGAYQQVVQIGGDVVVVERARQMLRQLQP